MLDAALFQFIMTAVSVALPIPAGVFFPVFLIGEMFELNFFMELNYNDRACPKSLCSIH